MKHRGSFTAPFTASIRELLAGRVLDLRLGRPLPVAPVLFPGAFNPLHAAHRRMASVAEERLGRAVAFELSVVNVDKPALDAIQIRRRCAQFSAGTALVLTRAPQFVDKSELFPAATFVVGSDTMQRIADVTYYRGQVQRRNQAIHRMIEHGIRFLVFGRTVGQSFVELDDLALPSPLRALCEAVDRRQFHMDLSSSELRK